MHFYNAIAVHQHICSDGLCLYELACVDRFSNTTIYYPATVLCKNMTKTLCLQNSIASKKWEPRTSHLANFFVPAIYHMCLQQFFAITGLPLNALFD